MVQTCCIKNCSERQKRGTNISFHQFPKNPDLKQEWIKAIKYDNFEHSPHSRICSKHFASDCFVESPWCSKRILRDNAVPNILDAPGTRHTQEMNILNVPCTETENETASLNNEFGNESVIDIVNSNEENLSLEEPLKKQRKAYVGDFKEYDTINDKENYVEVFNSTIAKKNKQIKILQQKNRRLVQRIQDLQSLVDDLKNKHDY